MNITVRDLLDAGVHFGHQVRRWNPRSKPFIHDHRHGISIIDLEKTYEQLEIASKYVEDIVASGKDILFVGTKRQAKDVIRETATNVSMPFSVNRWMGGTLTNFVTIKSSLSKYHKFLEMETDGRLAKLPGKEAAAIRRQMERMFRNFEGLKEVKSLPAALFVIDIKSEQIAVAEARILGIPIVALVDTNSDPTLVDYPIPGNDDAVKSIRLIVETISEAVQNGLARRDLSVSQKDFTPRVREEDYDESRESGVTLPEGYEEFGDAVSAAPAAEAVEEQATPAPAVEEAPVEAAPAPETVAEKKPVEEEKGEEEAPEEKTPEPKKEAVKEEKPAEAEKKDEEEDESAEKPAAKKAAAKKTAAKKVAAKKAATKKAAPKKKAAAKKTAAAKKKTAAKKAAAKKTADDKETKEEEK